MEKSGDNSNRDNEQLPSRTSKTKVLIITEIDDDNNDLLSYLNPSNVETLIIDLEKQRRNNIGNQSIGLETDCCSSTTKTSITQNESSNINPTRKRKATLTCVICGGQAFCYNFSQISCESCKAFFRRNAIRSLDNIKCISTTTVDEQIHCNIRYNVKQKCPRCRLLKCFLEGMRRDFISSAAEKQQKRQKLEENRRLQSELSQNPKTKATNPYPSTSEKIDLVSKSPSMLTEADWLCLNSLRNSYLVASKSSPSASSVLSLELAPDKMSAFMNTIDIQNFTAVRLINFIREVPEFTQLNENDRLILIKYNLTILFVISHSLKFDPKRELCYDLDTTDEASPAAEAFALHCKSLFILCYGYEFNRAVVDLLHTLVNLVNQDPIVVQLLMLIAIFSKGLSADDSQEPVLNDFRSVLDAQSKYIDLLFRYLLEKSTFEAVIIKMTRITELLLKIQKVWRDFHQYVKSKVDLTYINPLMRSLLHLT